MCLLKKITYGEFSEFIREKKITYKVHTYKPLELHKEKSGLAFTYNLAVSIIIFYKLFSPWDHLGLFKLKKYL